MSPPPCSPTGSLWREKLYLKSQWFFSSFISVRVPSKEPSHEKQGKHLVTVHGAHVDGRPTYSGVQTGSLRGLFTTLQSLPQCHAAFSTIPSALAWVDLAGMCCSNSHEGVPSTTVTASHVTQARLEYKSMIPPGTEEALDLRTSILYEG